MVTTRTMYEHITIREDGKAVINGATMKFEEPVAERLAWGWSPEELHLNHPDISLGQIHSALAYYWDHEEEMNERFEKALREFDQLRAKQVNSPLVKRLRTMRQV
jgi:uncharacterized protein (DUF433 family)